MGEMSDWQLEICRCALRYACRQNDEASQPAKDLLEQHFAHAHLDPTEELTQEQIDLMWHTLYRFQNDVESVSSRFESMESYTSDTDTADDD